MKIGLNLYSIRNMIQTKPDLIKTLQRLKKAGCDFVQFSGSPVNLKELKDVVNKTKMPIVVTHVPYERIIKDTDNLIKEHLSFNCKYIGLGALDRALYNNEKKLKDAIKDLEKAASKISKKGLTFFFHNHNFEFRKLSNGETIYDYIIRTAPHIHFTLDTYWVQYGGRCIIKTIESVKNRVECVHLKDYMINEKLIPEFAPLGDGVLDFKAIVKAAKKAGTKYFLIEQDNAAEKPKGFNDVLRSIKYIKENF